MSTDRPPARRVFRYLAAGVAVFCCALAGLAGLGYLGDDRLIWLGVFLLLGLMMSAIATTGTWPPHRGSH